MAGGLFLAFEAAAFAAGFAAEAALRAGLAAEFFLARLLVAEFALAAVAAFAAPAFAFGLGCAAFAAFAGGLHAFDGHFRQLAVDVALDFVHFHVFVYFGKGNRQAGAAGAAGAADAVHIIFGLFGQVVVDHMGDAGHVNAARGHVGGHENFNAAFAQVHQRAVAPALRHVAVQAVGGEALLV